MNKFDFLPERIATALKAGDYKYLSEIRLRIGFPVVANCGNQYAYLSAEGITLNKKNAITCGESDIREIMANVTERSLYAFNDRIKQGYLTDKSGCRIGIAGECVTDSGQPVTIKNVTSLNIRIPHDVEGCSAEIFEKIMKRGVKSTLILSPPAQGKTTILKDLARKINDAFNLSVLIIDERGEFGNINGENIDSVRYADKLFAFSYAVRSMSPNVVITDELSSEKDWDCAYSASNSGVKIIASCHARDLTELQKKPYFKKDVFERFVELSPIGRPGRVDRISDENFNPL